MNCHKGVRALSLGVICVTLLYVFLKSMHVKPICISPDSKLLFDFVKFSKCHLKCLSSNREERKRHHNEENVTFLHFILHFTDGQFWRSCWTFSRSLMYLTISQKDPFSICSGNPNYIVVIFITNLFKLLQKLQPWQVRHRCSSGYWLVEEGRTSRWSSGCFDRSRTEETPHFWKYLTVWLWRIIHGEWHQGVSYSKYVVIFFL